MVMRVSEGDGKRERQCEVASEYRWAEVMAGDRVSMCRHTLSVDHIHTQDAYTCTRTYIATHLHLSITHLPTHSYIHMYMHIIDINTPI